MSFRIDERDIRFNMFEHRDFDRLLKLPRYAHLGRKTVDDLIDQSFSFAKAVIAPINAPGDQEGCELRPDGTVRVPQGYRDAYKQYCENGFIGLSVDEEWGGIGAPACVGVAANEACFAGSVAFMMYPGLTHAAAEMLIAKASKEQCETYVPKLVTGEWSGTMCLTEAGAGSAVGDSTTTARPIADRPGFYKITGSKIFISGGDHDLAENIVHMVLAKTPEAPAGSPGARGGVRGLSIFIVPKFRPNPDGTKGAFNDVRTAKVEHKLGISGSATCVLNFGDAGECEGWRIGNEGDGIEIMFNMMNEARLGVGIQSMAVAGVAYEEALQYAQFRIQGVRAAELSNVNAQRVAIIEHPDVRRMLLLQRAFVQGLRALVYETAHQLDLVRGGLTGPEADKARRFCELVTPMCKAWGSDRAFEATTLAVQTYGGYGYIREYPVEQYLRDTKIFSIYEGTNAIQGLDLLGRKLRQEDGKGFMEFMEALNAFATQAASFAPLKPYATEFSRQAEELQNIAMNFMMKGMSGDRDYPAGQAVHLLEYMGNLLVGRLLGAQAMTAWGKLVELDPAWAGLDGAARKAKAEANPDIAFYDGKVKTAVFFCSHVLPRNLGLAKTMLAEDRSALDFTF